MNNIVDEDDMITKRDNQHKTEMKQRKAKQVEAKLNYQDIFLPLLVLPTIRTSMSNTPLLSLNLKIKSLFNQFSNMENI